jgi:hypothetical protein
MRAHTIVDSPQPPRSPVFTLLEFPWGHGLPPRNTCRADTAGNANGTTVTVPAAHSHHS